MKTFTDIVESKIGKLYPEFSAMPELSSYLTYGFPNAISSYLIQDMFENEKSSSELVIDGPTGKLMRFTLTATKKGDSIAFVPEFSILDAGKELISSDEIDLDSDVIVKFAEHIKDNNKFLKCLAESYALRIYVDGEWKDIDKRKLESMFDAGNNDAMGLVYDEETDVAVSTAVVILAIIEILCNNKDASSEITYSVPSLGTFKVSPIKGGYSVSLTYDKEFKANCKSDKLAELISDNIQE